MWRVIHSNGDLPRIGLVVLNYNNASESIRFLNQITKLESICAIQVVDNASTDGSAQDILEYCNELKDDRIGFIYSAVNGGYGSGNNLGVQKLLERGDCEYVLIANPDTILDDFTVRNLAAFLVENGSYAAVAPLMRNPAGEFCQSAWMLPNRASMLKNALRLLNPLLSDPCDYGFDYGSLGGPADVEVLPGSLFLIRADVFERVGGFDEDAFLYGEENLLFAKIRKFGMKCALVPSCSYIHAHGTTITREISSIRARYMLLLESNILYCRKVLNTSRAFVSIYASVYRCGIEVFSFLYAAKGFLNDAVTKRLKIGK